MACHLFGALPLPASMMTYQLNPQEQTSVKFLSKWIFFSFRDPCLWKCLQNVMHFVQVSVYQIYQMVIPLVTIRALLTHWGWVTHICVSKLTPIGADNGLLPRWPQAIIRSNAGILLIGPLGTIFSELSIKIHTFSFKKMCLKMSSVKWCPSCLGLNVYMWHRSCVSGAIATAAIRTIWRKIPTSSSK